MTLLSQNIRWLRKRAGMSQDELAKKTGKKTYTSVQHWETGHAEPSQDTLIKLSEIFSVPVGDLISTDLQGTAGVKKIPAVKIPVLGKISAGIPSEAIDDIIDYEDIPFELAKTGEFFGLRINGDSMSPLLPDGSTVIFRHQADAETGDIVAALIDGSDGVCKQYKRYDIGVALVPINDAYKPLFFPKQECDRLLIVGKAVEMRRKL